MARNFESNGPDVKIRGTAAHIAEKYTTLARDSAASGDNVTAENYLQHAEHYNRIIMAAQTQAMGAMQPGEGANGAGGRPHRGQSSEAGGRLQAEAYGGMDDEDDYEDAPAAAEVSEDAPSQDRPASGQGRRRRANGSGGDVAQSEGDPEAAPEESPDSVTA